MDYEKIRKEVPKMETFYSLSPTVILPGQYDDHLVESTYKDGILVKNVLTVVNPKSVNYLFINELINGLIVKKEYFGKSLVAEFVYNENGMLIYQMYCDNNQKHFMICGRHWENYMYVDDSELHYPTLDVWNLSLVHKIVRYTPDFPNIDDKDDNVYNNAGKNTAFLRIFDRSKCLSKYTANREYLRYPPRSPYVFKDEDIDTDYLHKIMSIRGSFEDSAMSKV